MTWKKLSIILTSLIILLMVSGCGFGIETTEEEVAEIEEQESAEIEVEKDEPEAAEGKGPGEVPIYPDAVRTSFWESEDGFLETYTYSASAGASQVENFYKNELIAADWNIFVEVEQDDGKLFEVMKDGNHATIFITECSSNPGNTEIIIEYRGN